MQFLYVTNNYVRNVKLNLPKYASNVKLNLPNDVKSF